MPTIPFVKMHGLGNDFVIVDLRRGDGAVAIDAAAARVLADRRRGIGCDQVIVLEAPRDPAASLFMRIRNPDGSEAEACGNATRCVAALVAEAGGERRPQIETVAGLLATEMLDDGSVAVDMGAVRTAWRDIPLAWAMDTDCMDLALGPLAAPVATSIGNPHATFFVADAEAIDLAALGPALEHDRLFPQRANIGVAALAGPDHLRLRVWERGAGITSACGSGACAALVAAHRRGLTGRSGRVTLDGGDLDIVWRDDNRVVMTGPVARSFAGTFDAALLRCG